MASSDIIITQSEYDALLKEIAALKEHISTLTALRDDLIYHICPALRSEYEEKIAGLERELYAAQLYLREKQRIIEILQAQMNRNKNPSMEEAEQEAGEEFRKFKEDLNRKAKEAEDFQDYWKKDTDWYRHDKADRKSRETGNSGEKDSGSMGKAGDTTGKESDTQGETTDSDRKIGQDGHKEDHEADQKASEGQEKDKEQKTSPVEEIKRLYRKIVKLLHPDVHPNPTEREKELLNRANDANARGDLEAMRAIWEELSGMHVKEEDYKDTPEDIARMKELIETLKKRCRELEHEIRHIKSQYPYTMKAFLDDELAVEERRNSLKEQIDQTREMDRKLAEYIEELRKQMGYN